MEVIRFRNYVVRLGVSYLGRGPSGWRPVGGYENAERFPSHGKAKLALLNYVAKGSGKISNWKIIEEDRP